METTQKTTGTTGERIIENGVPMKRRTEIWAHRGASMYAPENTLEAFDLAVRQKADGVELDVQMTKDRVLVVTHDEEISRVSDGHGMVKDLTLQELRAFSFNRTHPECGEAKLPTLQEVYELLKPTGLTVNVELKTGTYFYPGIVQAVLDLTQRAGMAGRVWYSSFNHMTIATLKRQCPTARIGILYSDGWLDVPEYAKKIGADALHPFYYNLQYPGLLKEARKEGLRIHAWTVNDPAVVRYLAKEQIDAVITNDPDKARKALESF